MEDSDSRVADKGPLLNILGTVPTCYVLRGAYGRTQVSSSCAPAAGNVPNARAVVVAKAATEAPVFVGPQAGLKFWFAQLDVVERPPWWRSWGRQEPQRRVDDHEGRNQDASVSRVSGCRR